MSRAFCDLAVSFAVLDTGAADDAVRQIETMVASEMEQALESPPEGVAVSQMRDAVALLIGPFREMTQAARHSIKQVDAAKNQRE